ncbi:hypothetical protein KAOT1_00300 [Kordia algicida OT-1]|uniref:Uncharacterized protein n=2 Tax=Kordia TaxID=221065 RepID=A9E9G6_9FLAO|nr:hypothetical protein KAOT1_00300 [Kordia algicida OT-1]
MKTIEKMNKQLDNWYDQHERLRLFYKELLEENEVAQITVTNCSDVSREITLWGTNKCAPIANPLHGFEEILKEADLVLATSEVVYNPVNDLFYVLSSRDDSLIIVNDQAVVLQTISLRINELPLVNPNNIVVNTNPNSIEYGYVGITGIREKEFFTVDLNFNISRRISLANDPIDLVYNPVDDAYYITESVRDSVTKITAFDNTVIDYLTIAGVKTLGVNTDNGDLYIHNISNNNVDVYNSNGVRKGWIERATANENKASFYYHTINQKMYIAYDSLNSLIVVDTTTLATEKILNTALEPIDIEFNPLNNLMYVASQDEQKFTRIDADLEVVDHIPLVSFDRSFAISSKNGTIALNNATLRKLFVYTRNSKLLVKVSDDYLQIREDFKYNPMLISHVKVVASTSARINTLQIIESSISGKQTCESISLRSYQSPQGFGNVAEVFEMEGYIIDGRVCWRFTIHPNQQVTFLIYYQQLEMYNFLPEKARISTGVQMSKGIPEAWK